MIAVSGLCPEKSFFSGTSIFFWAWVTGMAGIATTIRYDERGFGLSDWHVPDFALESRIKDLEAVIDAAGLESFA